MPDTAPNRGCWCAGPSEPRASWVCGRDAARGAGLGEDADPCVLLSARSVMSPGDRGDESGLTGPSVRLSEEDDSGLGWEVRWPQPGDSRRRRGLVRNESPHFTPPGATPSRLKSRFLRASRRFLRPPHELECFVLGPSVLAGEAFPFSR